MSHAGTRAFGRWCLSGVALLAIILWVVSGSYYAKLYTHDRRLYSFVAKGDFYFVRSLAGPLPNMSPEVTPGFEIARMKEDATHFRSWSWGVNGGMSSAMLGIEVSLWVPFVLLAVPSVAMWWPVLRAARRRRAGLCECGYDRRDLPGGTEAPCPECGAKASPS